MFESAGSASLNTANILSKKCSFLPIFFQKMIGFDWFSAHFTDCFFIIFCTENKEAHKM